MTLAYKRKTLAVLFVTFCFFSALTLLLINQFLLKNSQALPSGFTTVKATYYGGEYDETKNQWIIDNNNQCYKIKNGQTSEDILDAVLSSKFKNYIGKLNCDKSADDPGVGYFDDVPLHNTVSFAELSNDYLHPDYKALGDLPARTKLEINYNGRCVVAEKLDVGTGGPEKPSIDLWWQTARSLGFKNGFDAVTLRQVSKSTPLTALGTSYSCSSGSQETGAVASASSPNSGTTAAATASMQKASKLKAKKKAKSKPQIAKNTETDGQVLSDVASPGSPLITQAESGLITNLWHATIVAIASAAVALILTFHNQRIKHFDVARAAKSFIHT